MNKLSEITYSSAYQNRMTQYEDSSIYKIANVDMTFFDDICRSVNMFISSVVF